MSLEFKIAMLKMKGKIKGLADAGLRSRRFISKTEDEVRARHWTIKRRIGEDTRHYLIAYGLLRGVPYEAMEKRCATRPCSSVIFEIMRSHLNSWEMRSWSLEKINSLLTRSPEGAQIDSVTVR